MPSVDISVSAFGFGLTFAQLLFILKSVMEFNTCQAFPPDLSISFIGGEHWPLHQWPLWPCFKM